LRAGLAVLFLAGSTLSSVAWAGDCAAPYTSDALLGELGTVEAFLRNNDNAAAGKAAAQMEQHLGCLNEILPPMILGRAYRAVGGGLYAGGNKDRGQLWLNTAMVVDPTFDYGTEDLPANHPVGLAWIDTRKVALGDPVKVPEKIFAPGTHYVDGKKLTTPQAVAAIPHLYQRVDAGTTSAWIIEGNAFPSEVLAAPVVAVVEPVDAKGKKPKEPKPAKPEAVKPEKEPAVADADPKPEKEPKVEEPKPAKEPKPEKEPAVADADPKPAKEPKPSKTPTTTSDGTLVVKRERPPEQIPLIAGGSLIMAGAGGLYVMASQAHSDFQAAETLDDVESLQLKTNRLVVMSAVALAVGAGTTTFGIIIDSSGTPLPAINLRF
jgi:hypothetical protein